MILEWIRRVFAINTTHDKKWKRRSRRLKRKGKKGGSGGDVKKLNASPLKD